MAVKLSDGLREQYDLGKGGQVYLWHVMSAAKLEAVVEAAKTLRGEGHLDEEFIYDAALIAALAALEE